MITITEWVSNLFGSKKEKNNHQLKIKTCCPNCFHQYNLDLEYSTTIVVKHNLTDDEINNINYSKRVDIEKKYKEQITDNSKKSSIDEKVEKVDYKVKTELMDDDLKYSTVSEFIDELENKNLKKSQETFISQNKYDYRDQKFYTSGASANAHTSDNSRTSTNAHTSANARTSTNARTSVKQYSNVDNKIHNITNFEQKIPNQNKEHKLKPEEFEQYKNILLSKNLDEIKKHSYRIIPDLRIIDYAIEHIVDIQIIRVLFKTNSIWSSQSLSLGVKSGNFDIILFLIDNGACDELTNEDVIVEIFTNALAFDNYQYLDLLKKSGLQIPENIIQLAIQKKALKVISHLINIGYKFTPGCFEEAVQIGDTQLLEFLKFNNCEWCVLSDYVKNNLMYNSVIIEWLKTNDCPWDI